jgi:hypothetical protein
VGDNSDTLEGTLVADAFTSSAQNAGTIVGIVGYSGFANLDGRDGIDTFTLNHAVTGTVDGSAGNDIFNLAAVTGAVDGGLGTDTVNITGSYGAGSDDYTYTAEVFTNAGNTITGDSLTIVGATSMGTAGNRMLTSVNTLAITGSSGAAYFTETSGLTLDQVNLGAGSLSLSSGGTVSQAGAAGPITADSLELLGAATYTLTNAANDVNTLSGTTTGAVSFRDDDGFDVAGLNAGANAVTLTTGAATVTHSGSITAGTLTLEGTGATYTLDTVNNEVSILDANNTTLAGLSFRDDTGFAIAGIDTGGGALNLNSGGNTTQSAGITAGTFTIAGAGNYTLTNATNSVTSIVGATTGNISYTDSGAIATGAGLSTSGNIVLDARGGGITGIINAAALTLDAAGAIDVDTNVDSLNASTTAAGVIDVNEFDTITLTDVDTFNGAITVLAGGAVTATDVRSLSNSAANDISITSTGGGIVAGTISAQSLGGVILDAQGGAITDAGGKITADDLVADAAGAVTLDTSVSTIDASANAAGALRIFETSGVELLDVDTVGGAIIVTDGGALTATDAIAVGGDLSLSANSIVLGNVSAAGNTVNLRAATTINEGTFTGDSAVINAATIGLTSAPTADVVNFTMTLTLDVAGKSGTVLQGAALVDRPPDENISAPGTVGVGPWVYVPTDADISAILASLATLSSAQQQLETLLDATTASEFFMTPPLEIYIDMAEPDEFDESVDDSLDDDF